MPSINIREIDNTGSETTEQQDFNVLVPGLYLEYKTIDPLSGEEVWLPFEGLITSVQQFNQEFRLAEGREVKEIESDKFNIFDDSGLFEALQLVSHGLIVLYEGAYTLNENLEKAHRTIPDPLKPGQFKELTESVFFKQFADRGKYDLRFISVGGFDIDLASAGNAAMKCAGDRGDAVALLDVPTKGDITAQSESGTPYEDVELNTSALIDLWVQSAYLGTATETIKRKGIEWDDASETYGRYAAVFGPQILCSLSVSDPRKKVTAKTKLLKMPASFNYLVCFNRQLANYPEWFATAGATRGVSPLANITPTVLLGDADINLLQPRSGGKDDINEGHLATNVVCNIAPYGNIIWGNRTMHPLGRPAGLDDAAIQLTASSFLNIRQLCCTLKKTLYRAGRRYTFAPNSDALWYNFKNAIIPTLEKMKSNQGIRGYQIVPVPTNKKALLVAKIIINPIEAVEDFSFDVILSDNIEVTED